MLQITRHDSYETWTISSPDRGNGIGTTVAEQLLHACRQPAPPGHLPLVITAAPVEKPKGALWIAGGDLIELAALQDRNDARRYAGMMSEAMRLLRRSGRIVITAVDGAAIGGGVELALAGDIRLATERSWFEFKQLRAGLATGYGSARRLVDLIGLARSERLLYFCEKISAAEAEQLGLVHRLTDSSAGLKTLVEHTCMHLGSLPPSALAAQKAMFTAACQNGSDSARSAELDLFTGIWRNKQHAAFLQDFTSKK
jgi:enoyl-CoA hydratase/carnithine racemase